MKKCFSSINDTSLTPGEITAPVINHGEEEEVDNTGLSLFSDRFFRPTSDVSISEMVYPNYLKFDVRIVLYQVPFQIKFEVILTNGYRDIDLGSWPKKTIRKNADNMSLTLKLGEFQVVFKFLLNNDTCR